MKQQQQLQACKIGREWKKANKLSPFDDPLLDQNLIRSESKLLIVVIASVNISIIDSVNSGVTGSTFSTVYAVITAAV